jgi:hypothetical protein
MTFAPGLACTYQGSESGEGSQCPSPFFNGNSNWSGGLRLCPFLSCFIRQPLALDASQCDLDALAIVDAELGASILAEIKLGQVAVKVLGVYPLVHANNAALEHGEKPLQACSYARHHAPIQTWNDRPFHAPRTRET